MNTTFLPQTVDCAAETCATPRRFLGTNNPRELRALAALLQGRVTREELDRVAGTSNSPEVIRRLRAKGLPEGTCLVCTSKTGTDRDGREVRFGVYSLTDEGRRQVNGWLDREGLAASALLTVGEA